MITTHQPAPAGALARIAYELAVTGDPYDAQAMADQAAAAYAATLDPAHLAALAGEQARQALAGDTTRRTRHGSR